MTKGSAFHIGFATFLAAAMGAARIPAASPLRHADRFLSQCLARLAPTQGPRFIEVPADPKPAAEAAADGAKAAALELDALRGKLASLPVAKRDSRFPWKQLHAGATAEMLALVDEARSKLEKPAPTEAPKPAPPKKVPVPAVDSVRPGWADAVEWEALLLAWLAGAFALPAMEPAAAAGAALIVSLLALAGAAGWLASGVDLHPAGPLAVLLCTAAAAAFRPKGAARAGKAPPAGPTFDSNILLGGSFTSCGMLDLAFDHLRKAPLDEEAADLLYDLGRACEDKDEWAQAAAVYGYISTKYPDFEDVETRIHEVIKRVPPPVPAADATWGTKKGSRMKTLHDDRPVEAAAASPESQPEPEPSPPPEPAQQAALAPMPEPVSKGEQFEAATEHVRKDKLKEFEKNLPIIGE